MFFWIATFIADGATVAPNCRKKSLAKGVSTFFINGKPNLNNVPRSPPFWYITYSVVPFNKIPLFSKDLITFIISIVSLFVSVIPEPSLLVKILY